MKVRLQTIYASQHVTAQPGSVIDVADAEGKALIAGKFATAFVEPKEPVEAPAKAESAEAPAAPENASTRPAGAKPTRKRNAAKAESTEAPAE